jgi:hypothetical protein
VAPLRAGNVRGRVTRQAAVLAAALLFAACGARPRPAAPRAPIAELPAAGAGVDATTLKGKLMLGYQGWFGCPDDGSPLRRWEHWFRRDLPPSVGTVRVDLWPDVSELGADERCATPFTLPDGGQAAVFSSYNPRTVDRHFRWMEEHGLPGVFLQRFTVGLQQPVLAEFRNGVLGNVAAAARAHGRVYAIMYDISGHAREGLVERVEDDWRFLVDELHVTDDPRYLRHRGRPVLAIWGLGFVDRSATPEQAARLVAFFKDNAEPRYRATLVGGVPSRWRSRRRDSLSDSQWARVYRSFDVISPWTVGRFRDGPTMDRFYREEVDRDLAEARRRRLEYLPVVFPGFSWRHLKPGAPLNQIPRQGGRFFWRQVQSAVARGCTMLYGAMFDEVDEGTALFKVAPSAREAPVEDGFVTLDAEGQALPADWYLRLAGEAQRVLRGAPLAGGELPFTPPSTTANRP